MITDGREYSSEVGDALMRSPKGVGTVRLPCACALIVRTENAWTSARATGSCRSLTTTPAMMPFPASGPELWLVPTTGRAPV